MNSQILHNKVAMVLYSSIVSESEVSITVLCQLCLPHYIAVRTQNCLKSTSVINIAIVKSIDSFHTAKEAIMCNHQINTFHC